jgi:hypothetical protein
MNYSLKAKSRVTSALLASALASAGAYRLAERIMNHRFGDVPVLAGGFTFIFMAILIMKGIEEIRRPGIGEERAMAAAEYLRKLNN